jgi:hypothetical protein
MLIKTDAQGKELWRRKISKIAPNVQDGKAILQDSATKKIIIAGYQYIGNSSYWTNYGNILILDSLGNKLSQLNYTPSPGGVLVDLIQMKDKKLVAVGAKSTSQTVNDDFLTTAYAVKFDVNSPTPPIWNLEYDQFRIGTGFGSLIELPNGEILVSGLVDTLHSYSLPPNNLLITLTKINQNGTVTWNRCYNYQIDLNNSENCVGVRSLRRTFSGEWIGALTVCNQTGVKPFFFVKWDSTGCDGSIAYCKASYTGINADGANVNSFGGFDWRIFPNPVNDVFFITTNRPNISVEIQIEIKDVTGRLVKQIKTNMINNKAQVNANGVQNGSYLMSINDDSGLLYSGKFLKID